MGGSGTRTKELVLCAPLRGSGGSARRARVLADLMKPKVREVWGLEGGDQVSLIACCLSLALQVLSCLLLCDVSTPFLELSVPRAQ